ncbi:MAG: LytR/AlgR family response regulator transcription factor [Flavobacteriales bacterium]|jgi:DNA-binding LytR/AlgR family response regulator
MRILIIEDEPAAAENLIRLIMQHLPEAKVVGTTDTVTSSLQWLQKENTPDVIFTDVQLADGLCFEIFKVFQPQCPIIFTTAYNEYAINAFKVRAVDYLLKPIKKREFADTIERIKSTQKQTLDLNEIREAIEQEYSHYNHRYVIRFGDHIRTITSDEIAYLYTLQKGIFVVTHEGKTYPLDKSLEQMEQELDPKNFFRINRQFIVSISSVGNMQIVSKSRVKIDLKPKFNDGDVISSTERSPLFKAWLKR